MVDRRVFYGTAVRLLIPIVIQNLINVGITSLDVIMLGRVGQDVLSGASLANQIAFIMNLFFFGVCSGSSVLIAQYWGKQDLPAIRQLFGLSMKLTLGVSLVFTAAVGLFPAAAMRLFTPEAAVIEQGVIYLRIVCISYFMQAIITVYLGNLRAVEKVVIASVVYLVMLVLNFFCNYWLIFGPPALGAAGAAWGTVIARAVALAVLVFYDRAFNRIVPLSREMLGRCDRLLRQDFFRVSAPVMINELIWGMGLSCVAAIMGHLGSAAVAANSVAQVMRQLSQALSFGISTVTAVMIGKTIGAGETEVARWEARQFVLLTAVGGGIAALIIVAIRQPILGFVSLSPQAYRYLSMMLWIMVYYVIGQSMNSTLIVGVFRAGGDTKFGLLVDVVYLWGIAIGGGALAAFVFHAPVMVVYAILLSDEIVKLPHCTLRYRRYGWLRNLTR